MKFVIFMTTAFVAMSVLGGACGQQNFAYASESIVSEQDKLSEATEFWRNRLKVDRTGWLRHLDVGDTTIDCKRICDQTAILAGLDAAVALCGSRDADYPGDYYTYEKCANPSTAAITKAAAIERVDTEIASFAPILAEKVEVNNAHYDSVHAFDVFKDELKNRAKDSGWNMSHFLDVKMNYMPEEHGVCKNSKPCYCFTPHRYYQTVLAGQHLGQALDYVTAVSRDTGSCYWVNGAAPAFDYSAIPFCKENKNSLDCQRFFDRSAKCAANKESDANKKSVLFRLMSLFAKFFE